MDFPFFGLRLALIGVFGKTTSVLFLLKNLASLLSFLYFVTIRPNVFKKKSNAIIETVTTIESVLPNDVNQPTQSYYAQPHTEVDERSRADTFDDFETNHNDPYQNGYYSHNDQTEDDSYNHIYHDQHDSDSRDEMGLPTDMTDYHNNENMQMVSTSHDKTIIQQHESQSVMQDFGYNEDDRHVPPHQVKRYSKKHFRKSLMQSNIFNPPLNEEFAPSQESDMHFTEASTCKKTAPPRPPPPSGATSKVTQKQNHEDFSRSGSTNSSTEEHLHYSPAEVIERVFPLPPDYVPEALTEDDENSYATIGSKENSKSSFKRGNSFSPELFEELANEVVRRKSKRDKNVFDDNETRA